jgi:predicted acetyltransferase
VEFTLESNKCVSQLEIYPFRMWFCGVQLPVGGIASVTTEESYRHRGYARQCMEYAVKLLRGRKQPLSFLFGIPGFYEQFGYAVVMPWHDVIVSLDSWRILPPEPDMAIASSRHEKSLLALYNAAVSRRVGPAVRERHSRTRPTKQVEWRTQGVTRLLVDDRGKVRGYVYHNDAKTGPFQVAEALATDESGYEQVLSFLLHETRRHGQDCFLAGLPPDDPFALFLRRLDTKYVTVTRASGGGMARILDIAEVCRILTPVFQDRVKGLKRRLIPKTLMLSTEDGTGTVQLDGLGSAAKVKAPSNILTQLLFGYVSLAETWHSRATATVSPELGELLFPRIDAFNELARNVALGHQTEIYGPEAWRPFLHIWDAAWVIRHCLSVPPADIRNQVFNVVGENFQKAQLAELVRKHFPNHQVEITAATSDPRDYRVSANRIASRLGFIPKHTVEAAFLEVARAVTYNVFSDPYHTRHESLPGAKALHHPELDEVLAYFYCASLL